MAFGRWTERYATSTHVAGGAARVCTPEKGRRSEGKGDRKGEGETGGSEEETRDRKMDVEGRGKRLTSGGIPNGARTSKARKVKAEPWMTTDPSR